MPFPAQDPKPFTRDRILALKAGQQGCYGLFVSGAHWVYVGRGDIRQRLLNHLGGDNPCIIRERPTHWVDVVTNNSESVEKTLIVELQPSCNLKVG